LRDGGAVAQERRRDFKMLVYGAIIGVMGNFLVSFIVENIQARGFYERTIYEFFIALSGVAFFQTLLTVGADLRMSPRKIGIFRICMWLSVIMPAFVWAFEFLIVPFIWSLL